MKILFKRYKTILTLLLIWLTATAFNLTKPVHFDDTDFLLMAKNIASNPLHPMLGKVNWRGFPEYTYTFFHPLLLPYIFALAMKIFGDAEIIFHLIQSLFSFTAIVFFFLLARRFNPENSVLLTAIFALGPAFLPSQNLMTDVPQLSLWLVFFWAITQKRYIAAAFSFGVSILIKYASFILFPIFLFHLLIKKQWKSLWVFTIPIFIIILWSVFNYLDYGSIHLLSADKTSIVFNAKEMIHKAVLWTIALGAVAPFTVIVLPKLFSKKSGVAFLLLCLAATEVISLKYWRYPYELPVNYYLRKYFFANGLLVWGLSLEFFIREIIKLRSAVNTGKIEGLTLSLWFWATNIFLLMITPFTAVRHILVVIPAFLLICSTYIEKVSRKWLYAGVIITVILGVGLGISDWTYANVYRIYSKKIMEQIRSLQQKSQIQSTVWHTGYLGWQWYALKNGMQQYDTKSTIFTDKDYVVVPKIMLHTPINAFEQPYLHKIRQIGVGGNIFTSIRLITDWPYTTAGYYASFWETQLPWAVSFYPLEEFTIYQVDKPNLR